MTGVGIKTESRLGCQMLGDVGDLRQGGTRRQGDGGTVIKQGETKLTILRWTKEVITRIRDGSFTLSKASVSQMYVLGLYLQKLDFRSRCVYIRTLSQY